MGRQSLGVARSMRCSICPTAPLHAEEIVEQLGLARSNVSTALKELQGYGIVRRVHVEGDRRDHFVAETDLWDMLMRIAAERKRREIDPTDRAARRARRKARERQDRARRTSASGSAACTNSSSTLGTWYEQVRVLPKPTLVTLMKLGGKVARFIPGAGKPSQK